MRKHLGNNASISSVGAAYSFAFSDGILTMTLYDGVLRISDGSFTREFNENTIEIAQKIENGIAVICDATTIQAGVDFLIN